MFPNIGGDARAVGNGLGEIHTFAGRKALWNYVQTKNIAMKIGK